MHAAKSESDITSLAPSSPRSPKRQHVLYYVQSPSRDSHDDENKSSSSIQPTPAFTTPSDSPSHPHSRTSSAASRVSGNLRFKGFGNYNKRNECHVIEEEDDDYEDHYGKNNHRWCQCLMGLLGFGFLFTLFCLIIWGVSKPYKPQITVESLEVFNFFTCLGSDLTGVPTKMVTLNCSLSMVVYNPATFFGIHVTADPINLMYAELEIAIGKLRRYYQPRESSHTVTANLVGSKVPLYGAGASFQAAENGGGVPVRLDFELQSRGNVVGRLVKTKHRRHVSCPLVIDSSKTKPIKFKKDSCTYD
ncbi:Late embryogenesis abundant protein, LEA_2 subgroup [Dillenia turbinata]|uniref:Late embryogenesis abundant protein, LEA_2 subgroup n=1 Tax=Dillenia turbinata TaxID=194707 RepID=A0AAN8ZL58_9MAGN